jgi:hypothetical protein
VRAAADGDEVPGHGGVEVEMSKPRLGIHALTKADNGFFGNPSAERDLILSTWRQMGVSDVKLVASGDSQLKAAKYLVEQGFNVMVRFYALPRTLPVPATDLMAKYAAVGVKVAESVNEPELEQYRPPDATMIRSLAEQHIKFADQAYRAGLKPLMPAFQGDRIYNWFAPFVKTVIDLGRKDALEGSLVNVHPRPSNNLPDVAPPGFCVRSYELFDDTVLAMIGHSLPMYATEWGYEPGDDSNATLPKIDIDLHTRYNVRLQKMDYRPCLQAVFYWSFLNDWSASGWWRGDVAKSLPVVKAFIAMHNVPPPPPPSDLDTAMRAAIHNGLASWPYLQRSIVQDAYLPLGGEVVVHDPDGTWLGHGFVKPVDGSRWIRVCKLGEYGKEHERDVAL